jgi:hypothetical protein
MKTAIVVSFLNRPEILHETILAVGRQTISPVAVVVSLCNANSAQEETLRLALVMSCKATEGCGLEFRDVRGASGRAAHGPGARFPGRIRANRELDLLMAEGRDSLVQQAAQKILVAVAARQRARDTARKTAVEYCV